MAKNTFHYFLGVFEYRKVLCFLEAFVHNVANAGQESHGVHDYGYEG